MRRSAPACIFCGASKLSQEHVFPRWLATLLTAGVVGDEVTSELTRRSADRTDVKSWPARDVASYAIRVVCRNCNQGWMSDTEATAKPILSPMVRGDRALLSASDQLALAAWATMKAYIAEYALGEVVVATKADRRGLMSTQCPPGAVAVRIGAVERVGIADSVTRLVYSASSEGTTSGLASCTTFTLGCVVLQVCHGLGISIDWTTPSELRADYVPIYPPCPGEVHWPPAVVLTSSSLAVWERPIPASDPGGIAAASDAL